MSNLTRDNGKHCLVRLDVKEADEKLGVSLLIIGDSEMIRN